MVDRHGRLGPHTARTMNAPEPGAGKRSVSAAGVTSTPRTAILGVSTSQWALAFVVAGAMFLRIWKLWLYVPSMDEIQFLTISRPQALAEIWRRGQAELHPPLAWFIRHYLLVLSQDIFTQRLFSVAAGLLAI